MAYGESYRSRGYRGDRGAGYYGDSSYRKPHSQRDDHGSSRSRLDDTRRNYSPSSGSGGFPSDGFNRRYANKGRGSTYEKEDWSYRDKRRWHHSGAGVGASGALANTSGKATPLTNTSDRNSSDAVYSGTDTKTGVNRTDLEFTKLAHHTDFTNAITISNTDSSTPNNSSSSSSSSSNSKNYKVLYDPELDTSLSKAERKMKSKKLRFNGEGVPTDQLVDPRIANLSHYLSKPNKKSSKFPFKQLPQARFIYDSDSLGPAPLTTLVIWDLPISVNMQYLKNYLGTYGSIENIEIINDPNTAVPLGVATFRFKGTPEKSSDLATKFVERVKIELIKINGIALKIGLNDSEDTLLNQKVNIARGKIINQRLKREQEEEKRRLKLQEEQKKQEEIAKKEAEIKKQQEIEEAKRRAAELKYKPNTTLLSSRHDHKVEEGVFLPNELTKYIKNRPYLLIRDKYVPTKKVSSQEIKRTLKKYDWTRVLSDKTGYYVVFNSLKECIKCFEQEDCRKLFEFRLVMELAVPEGFEESQRGNDEADNDIIEEASNVLIKEFESFLVKDIRERIIAPHILKLLDHSNYPALVEELKAKEQQEAKAKIAATSNASLKLNALSLLEKQKQNLKPKTKYFKQVEDRFGSRKHGKKGAIIPMQHALNDDDDDDDDHEDEDDDDGGEGASSDEDEITSGSATPMVREPLKRVHSSSATSIVDEFEVGEPERKKHKKSRKEMSTESDDEMESISGKNEEDTEDVERVKKEEEDEEAEKKEKSTEEQEPMDAEMDDVDQMSLDSKYRPTEKRPRTVYPETTIPDTVDLRCLQEFIKDAEDLEFAQSILGDVDVMDSDVPVLKNIEYWAWKQGKNTNESEEIVERDEGFIDDEQEAEEIEEEPEEELPAHLESASGCFKSEGYKKIPDEDKNHYLPHRKRADKFIKTVQYEEDDDEKATEGSHSNNNSNSNNSNSINNGSSSTTTNNSNSNTNAAQSSRVNRANNRRFAADITAQIGTESDVLSLNALTKRKKPVTFARSSIHNWGLYAMEPIAAKEMIIEYVGERIRQQVAEHREKSYLRTGIGSSYLFRIDENTVIDATKKGGIARFINHCCSPSCTAKIIKVDGKKRIVIYALRDIEANEELTYDYKFERETNDDERIRCLCGAPGCKGFLN
ncbi:histone methyltransferase set1 [Lodderomyces elongisporus]|uniref:histone methyltransferase set1 n=1 Tax=Lodderomyces elongisporus TaxID=36914 RepID=UPI0029269B28|nr:histone methyltransferase set1 [Lodderomyces elongisporus]WLF77624.1 histone methyltransferase set1 [Lodderomyces elongisporus]